ncbi:unnamed protein product [Rhodiola kirilowii]
MKKLGELKHFLGLKWRQQRKEYFYVRRSMPKIYSRSME